MDEPAASEAVKTPDASTTTTTRKRLGRPPKANPQPTARKLGAETTAEDLKTDTSTERALRSSPTLGECRRSSRKKIIKFDVRDLLNKNRKANKNQIEAHNDSNVELSSNDASNTSSTCMLESESSTQTLVRDADAAEAGVLEPSEPHLLSSPEVFAKPKPTDSPALAQRNSEVPSSAGKPEQNQQPTPRKRGRPRKVDASPVAKIIPETNSVAVAPTMCSDSDNNSTPTSGESDTCVEASQKAKLKSKLRVSVKRMTMTGAESSDSGESSKGSSPSTNLPKLSASSPDLTALQAIQTPKVPKQLDDTKTPAEAGISVKTETTVVLAADEDDSNSQIIFEEVTEVQSENKAITESVVPNGENRKTFFELLKLDTEEDLCIASQKQITEEFQRQADVPALATSPVTTSKRRSQRSSLRGSGLSGRGSKMTLEETFAEIAAASSKIILESELTEASKQETTTNATIDLIVESSNNDKSSKSNTTQLHNQLELDDQLETCKHLQNARIQLDNTIPIQLAGLASDQAAKKATEERLGETTTQLGKTSLEQPSQGSMDMETPERQPSPVSKKRTPPPDSMDPKDRHDLNSVSQGAVLSPVIQKKTPPLNSVPSSDADHREASPSPEDQKGMPCPDALSRKVTPPPSAVIRSDTPPSDSVTQTVSIASDSIPEKVAPSLEQPDTALEESHASRSATSMSSPTEPSLNPSQSTVKPGEHSLNPEQNSVKSEENRTPTPTASGPEKAPAGISIVECDALFKALDKASAQLRLVEKAKKKPKPEKQTVNQELELKGEDTSSASPANKRNTRRNTVCEERAEGSLKMLTSRRLNSQHPCKRQLSPEPIKAKLKKAAPAKRASSSLGCPEPLDSRSCALQSASRGKTGKASDALQLALAESESSESTSSGSKAASCGIPTPTAELDAPSALADIALFIEDGVKLLDRDFKAEEEEQQTSTNVLAEDDYAQRVANIETPATTPSSSPQPANGVSCTQEPSSAVGNVGAVRRSHRIKQKPQLSKAGVVGRGAGNARSSQPSSSISMEMQLAELAHIDAINEQFLRQEGLNTFQPLRDNYYRCARQVSQENAEMQCDCFLTGDEEAMGQLSCGAGCINRMLMIECGPLCTNGERCTNKRFQQHQCWPCRVFRTEKKGCGITAELQIPPGEFIMEYVGEVIDSEEFERRQHLYSRDRNRHYYFMALRGEAIIDATAKGNISRYINHSCDPNAETQKWTVNGELRIGFFSVKTIQPGEEITFDYQYQRYGRDAQRCYCEAANCRGWIGGEPDSDEGEQLDGESDSEAEYLADETDELEAESDKKSNKAKAKSVKAKSSKSSKLPAGGRKKQPKPKDREYKAGRWLRPSSRGASASGEKSISRKLDKLEDPDVLEQLLLLNRSGLKNQADTLRFSRCMVRAKLLETRLQLLGVLTRGELPCRRLFLDYHGLRLLHAWISESGSDNQLRLALIDALESLPIPNRTMLNDSRVFQSVQLWSTTVTDEPVQEPEIQPQMEAKQTGIRPRIVALLEKWSALPEIFRIPKRERIEQMKEHEREADRQQPAHYTATALEDSKSNGADRYRQDRFRRDTTNRYEKPKPIRVSGINTICSSSNQLKERNGNGEGSASSGGSYYGISKSDPRRRPDPSDSDYDTRRTISKKIRRSLFERKVALDEAEKRVCNVDWREHEMRCEFFGADLNTDPKQLPHYQNTETLEWFNSEDAPVAVPLRCGNASGQVSPETSDGVEYRLPPSVEPLPPSWHWSLTADGEIYYYNLRERISQWEPPNAEQRLQQLIDDSPVPDITPESHPIGDELVDIDVDYVGSLSDKSLAQYIEAKVRERRELRRKRLVSVCMISPRREEDRLYNQLESRKYKENKEKIRRRKEIYRRKQLDVKSTAAMTGSSQSDDSLTIQGYLYSSDEEVDPDVASIAPGYAVLPLLDVIVDASKDTHVDELEALSQSTLNVEPSTSRTAVKSLSTSNEPDAEFSLHSKRKLPMPPQISENPKKHRGERDKKRKTPMSSTSSGREACEKFRFEISGLVAEFLRPYRKDNCQMGRITCDADYKFLIKRLSHHITTKEMRYCDSMGNPLACTESVKNKSFEFINQYMRKKGRVYEKPADEPDY